MSDKPDLSAILSLLANKGNTTNTSPEELLGSLMNSSNNSHSTENTTSNSSSSTENTTTSDATSSNMPDMEMMLKLMQVMKSSNQNTPSKELLRSLKPFLSASRKEKVDQYIKILGISNALELLNELGDTQK